MSDELIAELRKLEVVCYEPVVLKGGGDSDFYIVIKKAYGYPDALNLIADELWKKINEDLAKEGGQVTCIAASGYGGISPASIIGAKHSLNLTLVRDNPKDHGRVSSIEGYVPDESDKVVVIDDVFTSGTGLRNTIEVLRPTSCKILGCYVVVKRGEGDVGVPVKYLLTAEELR